MGNNKKTRMLTRNDKMATSNNMGVKKAHKKHQHARLNMKFFILCNRVHQDVEG
jgi:hypothetical protein